jgi:hypothetical protein
MSLEFDSQIFDVMVIKFCKVSVWLVVGMRLTFSLMAIASALSCFIAMQVLHVALLLDSESLILSAKSWRSNAY